MTTKTPDQRLKAVRASMKLQGLEAFIVPYADAFQSRNSVAPGAERLSWLTGFRGSAGCAVITPDRAAIFVDGRYTLSARTQIDAGLFEVLDSDAETPITWLQSCHAREGGHPAGSPPSRGRQSITLGYDPFLHTKAELDGYAKAGVTLKPCTLNPVDSAWGDKGLARLKAVAHDIRYCGRGVGDKVEAVCTAIREAGDEAACITRPDSVSWLLNLRVPDLPVVPVIHGYAVVDAAGGHVTLFTDADCTAPAIAASFGKIVNIRPLADLESGLKGVERQNWQLDDSATPAWFRATLEGAGRTVRHAIDPVTWPKACKNEVEQAGIRASHIRDGVALVRFLHAIDTQPGLTEREIEKLVLDTRAAEPTCFTHSFEPIVGFNANGAFVHGQVPDDQVKTVEGDGLLLIDSGGQYLDGTTDVTRTLAIGIPSPRMKHAFTTVMRGHIALAAAVFPEGTSGGQLDALARAPLWAQGYSYSHGTGHGVGYCLNVHEGPCNFSPKILRAAEPLKPGILMSVEPGVYIEGQFGIRLENLYLVVPHAPGFLRLEAVTLAPFDTRALDLSLMQEDEKDWLNAYHAKVLETIAPHLEPPLARWLTTMCAPV